MDIYRNYSLKNHNTFGFDVTCRKFITARNNKDITDFIKNELSTPFLIIGEGSNLLFIGDYPGTVVHPAIKGIEILDKSKDQIEIIAGSGNTWDDLVAWCCDNNYGGLENLSLIPGATGSAAVQNIGAYGTEVKDRILWVEGISIDHGKKIKLSNEDCHFDYRSSVFKNELKNKFIITGVAFRLDLHPEFVLNYGRVADQFARKERQNLSSLREVIKEIRESKLPDPKLTGNAGSFFKNPIIDTKLFKTLKGDYPDLPSYPAREGIKIPAGWLIEKSGWKGKREGDAGTWPDQALVLVNYGMARGKDILNLSMKIQDSVKNNFGISLEREVLVIG